jgi:hypothetical protein
MNLLKSASLLSGAEAPKVSEFKSSSKFVLVDNMNLAPKSKCLSFFNP